MNTSIKPERPPTRKARRALPARVRRLVESPTYVQADEDGAFLRRPEMCGVRLQLDYWKAAEKLQQIGIRDTVVVYGSTRIDAPARARRRLAEVRARLKAKPSDAQRQRAVCAADAKVRHSVYYEIAREFGRLVGASQGSPRLPRLTIVTGGGPGIMEAANRGAFESHSPTVGMNIALPYDQLPNAYLTPELCFRFHYFAIRKLHLLERAKAAVFFPGGYGTCDELFEVLTLLQTKKIDPIPVVLVSEAYWRSLVDFDMMADEGMIARDDLALFCFCESAQEIWSAICKWHDARA
ncbi:TIGR00730 family Rossman fold protein [Paraburkholderia sp. J94]|uniref:LOG family protein n=1 Tax=Paraburkholderia sp. J94 TaxID=2805441 RepID=UPI002AB17140|nr:TIGR00730 family Rossman fold protein [Paraburkholderia sp. J94]